ncbi:unnamed protein product [Vitrella brassicaformis CCMP3155]|uniref:Serine--tRNA ligase n=2 Tax=Vitrella brassicaformis TaxID=1169539 RepID=A0A0G4ELA2_VITBC|nr:unnamed protein product [Vitrella brassicaformis CCMP3155]|eukprot:CEL98192.1 unnamed protein product [Vitrella brassicaformis CCMP3155]
MQEQATKPTEEVEAPLVGLPEGGFLSVDLRLVALQPDTVRELLRRRGESDDSDAMQSVDEIGALSVDRSRLISEGDAARSERNTLSQEIGSLYRQGKADEAESIKAQVESATERAAAADAELSRVDAEIQTMLLSLPNALDELVPEGADESDNEVVTEWTPDDPRVKDKMVGDGEYMWHDEIAARLGCWKADQAAQLSGSRFAVYSGGIARMERALGQLMMDVHTQEHGYEEHVVPYLVSEECLVGTGQLPKFTEDLFTLDERHSLNGQRGYLIPTAEVPLTNVHRESILDESDLPKSYVALTPCFRAEAGSYGKDTKGLFRQHVFHKVELVKICTPDTSRQQHEAMTRHAEHILRLLGLPYRKVRLCGGDIGFSAAHCYDLEVWLPSQQRYREISSISNCWDFQARRMALRYRPKAPEGGKKKKTKPTLCHTINGSGVAVGRCLIAVLENFQRIDESTGKLVVDIPEALQVYMKGKVSLVE